jgi:hypothetical protein
VELRPEMRKKKEEDEVMAEEEEWDTFRSETS